MSTDEQNLTTVDALDTIELPEPGTVRRGQLRFSHPTLADWSWPYTVTRGATDGPRLAVISGVHPTEYPAIEANIRVTRALDPAALSGTVVSLPLINIPSFLSRTPFVSPIDQKNPNRAFPGDPAGTFTETLTDAIFRAVIAPSDFLVDLHGGDMVEDLVPFSIYSVSGDAATDRASAELGRAFGLPYLVASTPQPGMGGTTTSAAAAAGVPGVLAEAGGRGLLTEPETQLLVDGVGRVLRHLGMVAGAAPEAKDVTEVTAFTWLRSPAEGLWYPTVAAGDEVTDGQVIGRIHDLFGEPLAEITTPHGGVVLFVTSSPAMPNDGLVMAIGAA